MRIAVASGKGGTGKTTVATNLARVAAGNARTVAYLDCDVEEPNGHIFLRPEIADSRPVNVLVPRVDAGKCTRCGECGRLCRFNAIACLPDGVLVFEELCHSCGGCTLVCPVGAIREVPRAVGVVEAGQSQKIAFVQGRMNVGEVRSVPLIRQVKGAAPAADLVIIDAPPGTSCPVIEAVRGADLVVLVTEPTPFGLHDLTLAVDMSRAIGLPVSVVVNRAGIGDGRVADYCRAEAVDILAEIPDDRRVAEAYSRGELACEALPEYHDVFVNLLAKVRATARPVEEANDAIV